MRKSFWSLAGLTASLLAGSAIAQTTASSDTSWMDSFDNGGRWYLGAKIGGNWAAHGTHLRSNAFGAPIAGTAEYNDGYIGAIQGGYAFNNGLSLELEGADRYNDVDHVRGYGAGRGSMQNYAVMGNLLYDLPIAGMGLDLPFTPFIGAGVGMADEAPYHIRGDGMPYPAQFGGPTKWGLAYQGIAGVRYNINENLDLSLEYRYFSRTDENYPRGITNDYGAHSAMIGFRYLFGEPAHVEEVKQAAYVAPRAAPPAAPRNYLVFFDFNKSDLTSDARGIVDTAASNAQGSNVTRLEVTGYTDTVGSDAYNMRLSRRRAESVSAELQAKGVPSSEIAIFAKGKHDLLVPTADGVKEPQNRRVQIIYASGNTPSS
jgi:outer membrane protein OmpA-like peptidoglycan-associated protein